jgi:peroxiredoxin Q/BCP
MFGLFSSPLPPGTPAPDFTLRDQDGNTVSLSSLRGKPVLLVFYPGDETPVCRKQLCEMRDRSDLLAAHGIQVLGINPQSESSHKKFRDRHSFSFPLLADKGQSVARLYRANSLFTLRTVYLIDAAGIVRFSSRGKPSPERILAESGLVPA